MGANAKHERPHRIAARLSDDEMQIIQDEMDRSGLDISDVLRLALRVYRDAQEPTKQGNRKR